MRICLLSLLLATSALWAAPAPAPQFQRTAESPLALGVDGTVNVVAGFDFTEDGKDDLLNLGPGPSGSIEIRVARSEGNGAYTRVGVTAIESASIVVPEDNLAAGIFNLPGAEGSTRPAAVAIVSGQLKIFTTTLSTGFVNFHAQTAPAFPGVTLRSVLVKDLDGDGRDDIVVTGRIESGFQPGGVWVILNSASGFQPPVELATPGSEAGKLSAGDLNGDGTLDLIVVNTAEYYLKIYLATTAGQYPNNPVTVAAAGNPFDDVRPRAVACAQIVPGGAEEFVVWSSALLAVNTRALTFSVFRHAGSNIFERQREAIISSSTPDTFIHYGDIEIADLNNDGQLDVVGTDPVDNTVVVLSIGLDTQGGIDSTLSHSVQYFTNSTPNTVTVANPNEDFISGSTPKLDIIATHGGTTAERTVDVFLNTKASGPTGPLNPPGALPPTASFTLKIGNKSKVTSTQQGTVFDFTAIQPDKPLLPADTKVFVQYSFTPDVASSWQNLPDSRMDLQGSNKKGRIYRLVTQGVPSTAGLSGVWFRTQTAADREIPAAGPIIRDVFEPIGPITIAPGPLWDFVVVRHSASSDNSGSTAYVGDEITYRVKFRNGGSAPATDVLVLLAVPKGTSLVGQTAEHLDRAGASRVKWFIESLPVGAEVEKSITVKVTGNPFSTVKLIASQATVGSDEIEDTPAVRETGDSSKPLETRIVPGLRIVADSNPLSVTPGGTVDYELRVENPSNAPLTNITASFRVPSGMAIEFLRLPDAGGHFTGDPMVNPSPTTNPALEPYAPYGRQLITWKLTQIPAQSQRLIRFQLRVMHDLPATTIHSGIPTVVVISATDYNVEATLSNGDKLAAYKGSAPAVRTQLSSATPTNPAPQLTLVKTASADGELAGEEVAAANARYSLQVPGAAQVATVLPGNRLTYTLHFANAAGAGAGRNVTIHDEIPDGTTFMGFIRFNDDPDTIDSSFGFTFSNKDGDPIPSGGEPWTDLNANGRVDRGEFSDSNGNKRYDAFTDTKFIDYNMGNLNGGEGGKLSYEVAATGSAPMALESLSSGAVHPKTKGGIQYRGYSITSENLLYPISSGKRVVSMIVPPATFNLLRFTKLTESITPGGQLIWDLDYQVNGGEGFNFSNVKLTTMLPAGYNFVPAESGYVDMNSTVGPGQNRILRPRFSTELAPTIGAPEKDGRREIVYHLGNLPGKDANDQEQPGLGRRGAIRFCFALPSVIPPVLLNENGFLKQPPFFRVQMGGDPLQPTAAAIQAEAKRGPAAARPNLLGALTPASLVGAFTVSADQFADVTIGRISPVTVERGETFTVTIFFANTTNANCPQGEVAMQIPWGTEFVTATPGVKITRLGDGTEGRVDNDTNIPFRLLPNARKPQTIKWDVAFGFEPTSGGAVSVTLRVKDDFDGSTISDTSCYVKFTSTAGRVAEKISIHVRQRNVFTDVAEAIGGFLGNIFGNFNPAAQRALATQSLSENSRQISLCGAGHLDVLNGCKVVPMRNGWAMVVGPTSAIAIDDPFYVAADDGACGVIVGPQTRAGFNLVNVPVSGKPVWTMDEVLDGLSAPGTSIVSATGANLVAAGGVNLVGNDGASLVNNKTGALVPGVTLRPTYTSMVAAGGMNMVAAGGGNLVAAGGGNLIGNDGSTLIGNDGSTLIGNDGSTLIGNDGSTLIGNDGSTLVAAGGGNLLSASVGLVVRGNGLSALANDMPKLIGNDGSTLIGNDGSTLLATMAGLQLKASIAPGRAADLMGLTGAPLVGNDGASLVAAGGLNALPKATNGLISNERNGFK